MENLRPARVTVHFSEFNASVEGITIKTQEALGQLQMIFWTDSQGNEIIDSEGTWGKYDCICF